MIQKQSHLQTGQKICDACRKQISSRQVKVLHVSKLIVKWKGQQTMLKRNQAEMTITHTKERNENSKVLSEEAVMKKSHDEKILEQMKKKFEGCTERSMKVQIFIILPKDRSNNRIQNEFPTAKQTT
ncbi:hypothetical protein PR048_002147 [Dryococelus australis]|uniref:Uncharacterized protein n=1 Tax=Dryococelus australis TaxID=614101 RepID=A0ABQ9IJH1_9NEOP|nr:hypothetical protein PR048_002147 [Dryococelus australis]